MPQVPTKVHPGSPRMVSLLERHANFWRRDREDSFLQSVGVFAPSVPITLPQPDGSVLTDEARLTPDMIDVAALIDQVDALSLEDINAFLWSRGQYLVAVGEDDLVPRTCAFNKIPWIEAMLGCPIVMTKGHIWNEHYPGDPEEVIRRGASIEHNPWFQLYLEFLRQLQDRLGQRFMISVGTLFRGTSDLVAAVMGVQEACVGWIDQPNTMTRLLRVCTDAILAVNEAGYKVLPPFEGGSITTWGLWGPAPIIATQADHSTLLSAERYRRQILSFDIEVIRSCPLSLLHLHNCGLHIAPVLVEVPELTAIEVAFDPYPSGDRKRYELEMLQLIQQHKALLLDVNLPSLEEREWLLGQLDPRALCFNARFEPEIYRSLPADMPGRETWVLG